MPKKRRIPKPPLPKLGKLAARKDPRTLQFVKYVDLPQVQAPQAYTWSKPVTNWGMMLNNTIGDCTIASAGHAVQDWSANATAQINIADTDILAAYSALSGYDPKTGLNDNGCVELEVLNYWRKQGIGGHKITAYTGIAFNNKQVVMTAIYLFGGIYTGIGLPVTAQRQDVWDVVKGTRNARKASWGGHAVFICDYDQTYLTCITWGELKKMTWQFFFTYCDEAYAIISPEFFKDGKAPNGFDMQALQQDLVKI